MADRRRHALDRLLETEVPQQGKAPEGKNRRAEEPLAEAIYELAESLAADVAERSQENAHVDRLASASEARVEQITHRARQNRLLLIVLIFFTVLLMAVTALEAIGLYQIHDCVASSGTCYKKGQKTTGNAVKGIVDSNNNGISDHEEMQRRLDGIERSLNLPNSRTDSTRPSSSTTTTTSATTSTGKSGQASSPASAPPSSTTQPASPSTTQKPPPVTLPCVPGVTC